jgi:hypothetical protein
MLTRNEVVEIMKNEIPAMLHARIAELEHELMQSNHTMKSCQCDAGEKEWLMEQVERNVKVLSKEIV